MIAVIGEKGQVATQLREQWGASATFLGRTQLGDIPSVHVGQVLEKLRPHVIINTAAYTAVDRAENEPKSAEELNVHLPRELARFSRGNGAKLIHLSTDFVFNGELNRPYREDDPTAPLGVYGDTKLRGELAIRDLDSSATILRTSWLFSSYGANFLKTIVRLCRTHENVRVVDDQCGCPTSVRHVGEIIDEIVVRLSRKEWSGGLFHYADGPAVSWHGFAERIFAHLREVGVPVRAPCVQAIPTFDYPTPARRPAYSVLDASALLKRLELPPKLWEPEIQPLIRRILINDTK